MPLSSDSPILTVRNLKKSFGKVEAVRGVSLDLARGRCLGLLGPNGAGKTTTIEMLEGILAPDSGEILFEGRPLGEESRRRCGIQFQKTALPDFLTVREVLRLFSSFYPRNADLDAIISWCRLSEFLDRDTDKLSGGQRQRVLLAIALLHEPDLIFLDEPTTGLDPQARRNFWELIRQIQTRNTTILLTTHYMDEAYELCDEIAIMDQGRIIAQGTPDALLRRNFAGVAIELPREDFDRGTLSSTAREKIGELFPRGDSVEFQTSDVDSTLRLLLDAGVPLGRLRVREQTLEDLFLTLTGKEIRG